MTAMVPVVMAVCLEGVDSDKSSIFKSIFSDRVKAGEFCLWSDLRIHGLR